MSGTDSKLADETARLAALRRYDVLDTPAESPFDTITQLVRTVLGVPISAVSLIDADRQWFKSHPGLDIDRTGRDVAFCDHTIRSREPLVVGNAALDERFRDNPLVTGDPNIASYAGVPLQTPDGYNIGSLCAIDTQPRSFDPAQMEILKGLAALVVEQLELRRIAQRDHLTGALSRRAFIGEMDRAISMHARHGRQAVLLLFDIDHFKAVNDRHGHAAGDEVLAAIAQSLEMTKRMSDCFGRLGGEEFGLLLNETGEAEAMRVADRYRTAIAGVTIGRVPRLRVTASFGAALLTARSSASTSWMSDADDALYRAKRNGRDRVCFFTPERQDAAA